MYCTWILLPWIGGIFKANDKNMKHGVMWNVAAQKCSRQTDSCCWHFRTCPISTIWYFSMIIMPTIISDYVENVLFWAFSLTVFSFFFLSKLDNAVEYQALCMHNALCREGSVGVPVQPTVQSERIQHVSWSYGTRWLGGELQTGGIIETLWRHGFE